MDTLKYSDTVAGGKKKTLAGFLAALTFLLATVALQLYFNKDHYFAMNRAKCSFTMIVLMGAMLTVVVRGVEGVWVKRQKQRMTLLDWCVLLFGCGSLVTCLLSQAPELTFVGTKGIFVGAFTYIRKDLTLAFAMLFGEETTALTYVTCHNSLLQALLGNGIIGLIFLLLGVYAMLRDWFRELRPIVLRPEPKNGVGTNVTYEEVIRVASFTAVMGYFGASLVESTYPHTVILLFAMLGLYRSSFFVPCKKKEPKA